MPNGLDFSYAIPQVNGSTNYGYEHPSMDNLRVTSSKIMHVDSNLNIRGLAIDPNPDSKPKPGEF